MPFDPRLIGAVQPFDTSQVFGAAEKGQQMANLAQTMGIQQDAHQASLASMARDNQARQIIQNGGSLDDLMKRGLADSNVAKGYAGLQHQQAQTTLATTGAGKNNAQIQEIQDKEHAEVQKLVDTTMYGATEKDWEARRQLAAQKVKEGILASPGGTPEVADAHYKAMFDSIGEFGSPYMAVMKNRMVPPVEQEKLAVTDRANQTRAEQKHTNTGTGQQLGWSNEDHTFNKPIGAPKPAKPANGGGVATGEDISPQALEDQTQAYRTTGVLPKGLGTGKMAAQIKMKIINHAAELDAAEGGANIAGNSAKYEADKASLKKFTTQSDAMEAAENTAQKNGEVLDAVLKDLPDGGASFLNKPLRELENKSGDPRITKFHASLHTYLTEAAKVLSGSSGNAAPTDSAMSEVKKMVPEEGTVAQIRAGLRTLEQDMGNRHSAVAEKMADFGTRTSSKGKGKAGAGAKKVGGNINLDDAPPAAAAGGAKPKTVVQNGHTYNLNEATGEYE